MKFVADLHLHSKYSRAVSQEMILPKMQEWAKYKGINVLATSDFTHPFWFDQLKKELEDAGNGLYQLRSSVESSRFPSETRLASGSTVKNSEPLTVNHQPIYFLLSCEISSIYSQGGKVRRVHSLFFFPKLSSVEKFNNKLIKLKANLRSDGRPIVGVSARNLAQLALECDEKALIIPAHAWTPWFSVFGAFSGFNSLEECFGDLASKIFAIESGLSSDPAMNWQIAELENRAILSFSDAHSLPKMGREATVFEAEDISYEAIYEAIADPNLSALSLGHTLSRDQKSLEDLHGSQENQNSVTAPSSATSPRKAEGQSNYPKIAFTIEFYPEEGKYHYTGHRDCNYSQTPKQTEKDGDKCPVCGRNLTIGVMHRVEELKTRDLESEVKDINGVRWVFPKNQNRPPYVSMVPLNEIIAEVLESAVGTKRVLDQYLTLVENLGNEFNVLLKASLSEIGKFAQPKVAEAIQKVREGNIYIEPGYDGKFGIVKIWQENPPDATELSGSQKDESEEQLNLFV